MAKTISTIIKIFALMSALLVCMNLFVAFIPEFDPDVTIEEQEYLLYINNKFNGNFDPDLQGQNILESAESFIGNEGLFTTRITDSFLGVLLVIVDATVFLISVITNILIIPGIIIEILLYGFIFNNVYLSSSIILIVNVLFYFMMFNIMFKRRISQN